MISTRRDTRRAVSPAHGGCVEVRLLADGTVGLRDSKDTSKPAHVFTPREWHAFVSGVRAGEFDLPPERA